MASSLAQEGAYEALIDASELFFSGDGGDSALIGGQMVTLLAYRWGMGAGLFRESRDADLGVTRVVLRDESLIDRFVARGYRKTSGNTLSRALSHLPQGVGPAQGFEAVIELLTPAYTSRPRSSVTEGDFSVTEVSGLAAALRSVVRLDVSVTLLDSHRADLAVIVPDEAGCLVLRAHAWSLRLDDRDAIDVWRALEIAHAAGVGPAAFEAEPMKNAADLVRDSFGSIDAPGCRAAIAATHMVSASPTAPRIVALVRKVLGSTS